MVGDVRDTQVGDLITECNANFSFDVKNACSCFHACIYILVLGERIKNIPCTTVNRALRTMCVYL